MNLIITDSDGKRAFTILGAVLTSSIIIFSLLLAMAQRYYEYTKLDTSVDKRKLFVLENVDLETNKICDNKFITLKKRIMAIKNGK